MTFNNFFEGYQRLKFKKINYLKHVKINYLFCLYKHLIFQKFNDFQ